MLESVFSFRGRINRLQYFVSVLALGAAVVVPIVAIIIGAGVHDTTSLAKAALTLGLFALIALPLFLWISFSLQARRFRDIGLEPLYVIPALIVFAIVDRLVAGSAPGLAFGAMHQQTLVGLLVNLASAGTLFFWPGRSDDDLGPDLAMRGPGAPEPAAEVPSAAPMQTAAPFRPSTSGGAATFGRRGL